MFNFKKEVVRSLNSHIAKGHKLRVQKIPGVIDDLELYCVYCGRIVAAGSPAKMNEAVEGLLERGANVVKQNNPVTSFRIH